MTRSTCRALTSRSPITPAPWGYRSRGLRLGVERPYFFSDLDFEYRNAVETAIKKLEELGVIVVEIRVPELELVQGIFINIIATDTSAYHKRLLRKNPAGYVKKTRVMLEFGELLLGTDYLLAQRARQVLRQAVRECFAKHRLDGLITPSVSATAPSMTTDVSTDLFAFPLRQSFANILGLPSMNVPCGFANNGLPIGFEVYGRPFAEPLIFQVASAYQAVTDWHRRVPPLARPASGAL